MSNEKVAWLRKLYEELLRNPGGFIEEYGNLDTKLVRETLGLPERKKVEGGEEDEEEMLEPAEDGMDVETLEKVSEGLD